MVMIMTGRKKQKLIHIVITENDNETNQDTLDNIIEECPDYNFPAEMEEGVNNEDDDEKEIKSENEYEGVIHRVIIYN